MTVSRDGITVRVRRRPVDPARLAVEVIRARDELLVLARRARGRDEWPRSSALREAADLISDALDRAASA